MKIKVALLATLTALTLALAACNTTAGAGKDISSTGHAITKAADENK